MEPSTPFINLGEDLASAVMEAMQEVAAFRDSELTEVRRKSEVKPPKSPTVTKVTDRTWAEVIDENGWGVAGVSVQLFLTRKGVPMTKVTSDSGIVTFGSLPFGFGYLMRVIVPEGVEADGLTTLPFSIEPTHQGYHGTFHLKTGSSPRSKPRRVGSFKIVFDVLEDEGTPYEERLGAGAVTINIAHPVVREAMEANDLVTQHSLFAQYVTAAFAAYTLEGDPKFCLLQASRLYGSTFRNFTAIRQARQKQRSRVKKL